jgi:hypothetical protein
VADILCHAGEKTEVSILSRSYPLNFYKISCKASLCYNQIVEKEAGELILMRQNSKSGMIEKIVGSALLNLITNPIELRIPISILLYL